MITRLHVKGFKSLKDLNLELRPLNVMIGPNGGGKSNVVDVLELLKEGAEGKLSDAIAARGGDRILWAQNPDRFSFRFGLSPPHEDTLWEYSMSVRVLGFSCSVAEEWMAAGQRSFSHLEPMYSCRDGVVAYGRDEEDGPGPRPMEVAAGVLALSVPHPTEWWGTEIAIARDIVTRAVHYAVPSVGPGTPIRAPQPPRNEYVVDPSGDNLVSVLHQLSNSEDRQAHYDLIIHAIRSAFPDFEDLRFPPEGEGYIGLRWHQQGFRRGFTPAQLSDGTLRFLWLLTIVHQPPTGGLIMIEEPEVGLHPDLIRLFAESLNAVASEEKQFLIATHSPELVSWLDPEDVLVVDKDGEGATQARRLDHEALGKWLESYTLGELWRMGEVGGRVW